MPPNANAMRSAIAKSLIYDYDFSEEEWDYTTDPDCVDDEEEMDDNYDGLEDEISELFPEGEIRAFLEEHLTKKKDLKSMALEIVMGGFGEGLPNASDVISYLFGNTAGVDVENMLEDCIDEELEEADILESAREMKLFKRFTDASILSLVQLKRDEYPDAVTVKIHLNTKGKISMEISAFEE